MCVQYTQRCAKSKYHNKILEIETVLKRLSNKAEGFDALIRSSFERVDSEVY